MPPPGLFGLPGLPAQAPAAPPAVAGAENPEARPARLQALRDLAAYQREHAAHIQARLQDPRLQMLPMQPPPAPEGNAAPNAPNLYLQQIRAQQNFMALQQQRLQARRALHAQHVAQHQAQDLQPQQALHAPQAVHAAQMAQAQAPQGPRATQAARGTQQVSNIVLLDVNLFTQS